MKQLYICVVLFLLPCGVVVAQPFDIHVSCVHSNILIGEHQFLHIEVMNHTNSKRVVPDIKAGLASGLVQLRLLDEKGEPISPELHADLAPPNMKSGRELLPDQKMQYTCSTEQFGLNMRKAGKYTVLVSIPIGGERYEGRCLLRAMDPDNLASSRRVVLGLEETAQGDEPTDRGIVQSFFVGKVWWLFYRRVDRAEVVTVRRLARLAGSDDFVATGSKARVELAYVSEGKETISLARLDAKDGTDLFAEK